MLFKRQTKLKLKEKLSNFFMPAKGIKRGFIYIWKRIWRINATPHSVALGVAAGAFASCTPFLGFHFIIAGLLAFMFRVSILASALGTAVGNPLTFPFIFWAISNIGNFILGGDKVTSRAELKGLKHKLFANGPFEAGFDQIWLTLKPMIVGGIPLGLLVGTICYFGVKHAVTSYQKKRCMKFNSQN